MQPQSAYMVELTPALPLLSGCLIEFEQGQKQVCRQAIVDEPKPLEATGEHHQAELINRVPAALHENDGAAYDAGDGG